jgi:PadR family transcriptional regulator, regulatory protein PadR
MEAPLRVTMNVAKVLRVVAEDPTARFYGQEIGRATGLSGGSLYPVLLRLEHAGVLDSDWEQVDPSEAGRPRRRLYWLTSDGAEFARRALREAQRSVTPGWSGVPGFPTPGGASA